MLKPNKANKIIMQLSQSPVPRLELPKLNKIMTLANANMKYFIKSIIKCVSQ